MFNIENFLDILIIFIAFGGFFLSSFIHHKKRLKEKLICPRGHECDTVIWSKYSKFIGLPLEILGIVYYGTIAMAHAMMLIFPETTSSELIYSTVLLSSAAFIFSLYLTYLQIFKLKQLCTWCLISALLSTAIFILSLFY